MYCEFRFPTLPNIENDAPRSFVKGIGRAFPIQDTGVNVRIGVSEEGSVSRIARGVHQFRTKDRCTTAWIRSSALGLESSRYTDFEDYLKKVSLVLESAKPVLDTDFFTRVGVRYINVFPADVSDLQGWVRDSLLGPIIESEFGALQSYWCTLQGDTEHGGYSLRYGLAKVGGLKKFTVDVDFFTECVDWDDNVPILHRFHDLNFRFYSWIIGKKALDYLGSPTQKKEA